MKRDQLKILLERWGREVPRERNMGLVATAHRALTTETAAVVDDRTWEDLDLDSVFAQLDRTVSSPGAQMLYHQLRCYESDEAVLRERTRQYEIFQKNVSFRNGVLRGLARLSKATAAHLAPFVLSPFPQNPPMAWVFGLLGAISLGSLIAGIFFHPLLLAAVLFGGVNLVISLTYGQRIVSHVVGFASISQLLGTCDALTRLENPDALPVLERLRQSRRRIKELHSRMRWLLIDRTQLDDLSAIPFYYLNMCCLFDLVTFFRVNALLRGERSILVDWFQDVGALDAAQATASYLAERTKTCVPDLVDERRIEATALYHPLIAEAVPNEVNLSERSVVIAGSNMSGKTSFMRTLGVNLILARTLHFCHAEKATFPLAEVRSAIGRQDDLEAGESYFFAELKQLLGFVQAAEEPKRFVFLIDEIFRGTNTVERIASSVAVLRELSQRQLVLATTHDAELQDLLAATFDLYHFSERIEGDRCLFDYQLRHGPARTRNAIKLLEISGYPAGITAEANRLAEEIAARFAPR